MKNSAVEILSRLKKYYPDVKKTALTFSNPLEILVATILSAQCTDERVNKITPFLFAKYKKASDYAAAAPKVFEQEIKSAGFYHNKAKNIIGACKIIDEKYSGKVPDTMENLLELPGVARKTANIVLGNAFGKIFGIAVDTHVKRLSFRLGLSKNNSPEKIEQDLMKIFDRGDWFALSNLLIEHGRNICKAQKPDCKNCFLRDLCPRINVPGN
ncbi:MAG: endonuclease III [Elusimicrobia bacterium CG06_land_8_20_14_3_00_38_11]|nr:MAG: endonuclease III [Elusimicrobia bacterium CG06_land_8_20_14_3_00_38_11]